MYYLYLVHREELVRGFVNGHVLIIVFTPLQSSAPKIYINIRRAFHRTFHRPTMDPAREDAIYDERFVRIVCVGAGASGICLAYKLKRSFSKFSLTVDISFPLKN